MRNVKKEDRLVVSIDEASHGYQNKGVVTHESFTSTPHAVKLVLK